MMYGTMKPGMGSKKMAPKKDMKKADKPMKKAKKKK